MRSFLFLKKLLHREPNKEPWRYGHKGSFGGKASETSQGLEQVSGLAGFPPKEKFIQPFQCQSMFLYKLTVVFLPFPSTPRFSKKKKNKKILFLLIYMQVSAAVNLLGIVAKKSSLGSVHAKQL